MSKPYVVWYPANSHNYTAANREKDYNITKIVIHVTQGSWSSAVNWFQNPDAGVSAHYVVRSSDGKIAQSVSDINIAWHAGHWPTNCHSIGIEHEGYISNPAWFTDEMYHSSARMAAYLCGAHRIPIDRDHIIGHYEVPGCPGPGGGSGCHMDPGHHWNWRRYMRLIRHFANR